jgi:hypothetical protein
LVRTRADPEIQHLLTLDFDSGDVLAMGWLTDIRRILGRRGLVAW